MVWEAGELEEGGENRGTKGKQGVPGISLGLQDFARQGRRGGISFDLSDISQYFTSSPSLHAERRPQRK